jgi:4-hydroxy-2-oxoheptanedioate aldolase
MAEIPRLNGIIKALANGQPAFTTFTSGDVADAVALSTSNYDGVVFEMEHNVYNPDRLKDCLQYMLNRAQIVEGGTLAPKVTPIVRIPPNGVEQNSWVAKQVLDIGAYGIVWPHVDSVQEARNAVAACRYPRPPGSPRFEPAGLRGDAPNTAARYWGLDQQTYYKKADVWPLDPDGEILVVLMIESVRAVEALPKMLDEVAGIGCILIGEGDMSQELGVPRQYDHPIVREHLSRVVQICKDHNVPVGHPHVSAENVERVLDEGYRFLMPAATRSYAGLEKGRQLAKRVAV